MADAALRLAETIALLQKTCDKPISPTRNKLPDNAPNDGRKLSVKQELKVVSCLSYLASYSDKPDRVMALCVEEYPDHQGIKVALATNTGSTVWLEQGVRSILEVLQLQARDVGCEYLHHLLTRVVAHGRARIVRRLGLKGTADSATAARLRKVVQYAKGNKVLAPPTILSLASLSEEFSRHCESFRRSASETSVVEILTTASRIGKEHREDISTILVRIPRSAMDDGTKEALKCRLDHLGHYIPAARCLLRYAQRMSSLFQSFEVIPVYLKPIDLNAAVSKRIKKKRTDLNKPYKVHAEVQLVAHYERTEIAYPPRILTSSKDACFLCDLFIKTHGKFYIPKTHGRVYELWMVPDMTPSGNEKRVVRNWTLILGEFSKEIETLLAKAATNNKRRSLDPRESGIFSLASTSTLRTRVSASSSIRTVERQSSISSISEAGFDWLDLEAEENDGVVRGAPEDTTISRDVPANVVHPIQQDAQPNRVDHERSCDTPIFELQPGIAQNYIFDSNHTHVRFHTHKIHIELSRSQADLLASQPTLAPGGSVMNLSVAWLGPNEAAQVAKMEREAAADLEDGWTTMTPKEGVLWSDSGLLIRNGEDLVQIKAQIA